MERSGAENSTRYMEGMAMAWKKYPLVHAEPQPIDSDSSSSNYELRELLEKTITHKNMNLLGKNPKLKSEYFDFINRIYQSTDSYHLYSVLELSFENAKDETEDFALETFNKVFLHMGFSERDTAILLEKWSEGMKEGNQNPFDVAKNGFKHHMISIIEVERHKKGGFHELFMDFGLTNAQRYYGTLLKRQLESVKQKNSPYIQGIMASGDHSSSMLNSAMLSRFVIDLNGMSYKTRESIVPFRAIEVGSHDEVLDRKQMLRKKYGSGKVLGYYVFGHANEKYITLSKNPQSYTDILTAEDMINLDIFGKNWGEHVKHPTIILDACSTGVQIAKEISGHLGARVFAPLVPTRIKWISVSQEGTPEIKSVTYADPSVVYDKGKLVTV